MPPVDSIIRLEGLEKRYVLGGEDISDLLDRIESYEGATDSFDQYRVSEQIEKARGMTDPEARCKLYQDLATQATCLAQALTKRKYDKTHVPSTFKVGDAFLLHVVPSNRLLPYFAGPYKVTRIVGDGNTVFGRWLVQPPPPEEGPFHVSRLLPFDASTTAARETALPPGVRLWHH